MMINKNVGLKPAAATRQTAVPSLPFRGRLSIRTAAQDKVRVCMCVHLCGQQQRACSLHERGEEYLQPAEIMHTQMRAPSLRQLSSVIARVQAASDNMNITRSIDPSRNNTQAQIIQPVNGDPFVGSFETPVTSSPLVASYLSNLPAYRTAVSPSLRGVEIGLAHGFLLAGPFIKVCACV